MSKSTFSPNPPAPTPLMRKHRLILRGDDAGSSETANQAIRLACKAGTLKNVSVMACGPAFDQAAGILKQFPGVSLGLHVTLNSEWASPRWGPITPAHQCPTLVGDDGCFRASAAELLRHGFSLDEAMLETQAQLDRMRKAGVPPVYLDEHMGVGWLPGLRGALAALAEREGLFDVMAARLGQVNRIPGSICGTAQSLVEMLSALDEGTHLYIMHPDQPLARWPGGEQDARIRDGDRRLLLDPDLGPSLQNAGVELITFPLAGRTVPKTDKAILFV